MSKILNFVDRKITCLLNEFSASADFATERSEVSSWDVEADVLALYQSFQLQGVRRYAGQVFWDEVQRPEELLQPNDIEAESVAAHSWQVANASMLLRGHFSWLDPQRVVELAILHDTLEAFTGDYDPVGIDGTGLGAHVFNNDKKADKTASEFQALETYLGLLRPNLREAQRDYIMETIQSNSLESNFVKSVDKLVSLAFLRLRKNGRTEPEHMAFTIRYSQIGMICFPSLQPHYFEVLKDAIKDAIKLRDERVAVCYLDQIHSHLAGYRG